MITAFVNRFLHWSVIGVLSPVMTLMILSKNVAIEQVGIIMAALSITVIALEVPSGILSDLLGRRRIYMISILLSLAAFSVILVGQSFLFVMIGLMIYGVSRAFSSGSIESLFIDRYIEEHTEEQLHRLMTVMTAGETSGLAAGALVGGMIPLWWERIGGSGSRYNGNLAATVLVLLVLMITTLLTTSRDPGKRDKSLKEHLRVTSKDLLGNRNLKLLLAGVFIWGFSVMAVEIYWQPRLESFFTSDNQTWILGVANGGYFIASLLGGLFIGWLLSRVKIPPRVTLVVSRLVMGGMMILLAAQAGISGFIAVYWIMFFFNGISNIPETTLYNQEVSSENRASLLSVASLVVQLGGVLGSLAGSLLLLYFTIGHLWLLAGALFLLSSLVYLGIRHKD